jgi:tRNA A-37 threonylcarbamoyl transferase component Bud32
MSEEVDLGIPGIGPATLVGRGGFGRVYRAVQASSGGVVAVKVVAGHLDDTGRLRFERETRALGRLRGHPNICTVFDAGADSEDRPYLVMEYAPTTLAQRLTDAGAMPWSEASDVGIKLAGALHTAHSNDLLHRDVKPENVLIDPFGVPKLADFGLARFADETMSRGITTTVSHAAPELLRDGQPTVASDVYALGSTLFAALTGHVAFALTDGAHHASLYRRIEEDPIPELTGVPDSLAEVVRTSMAKRPEDRYASALALGEALRDVQRSNGVAVTVLPLAASERPTPADPAAATTVGDATPQRPEVAGGLTEAVVRANREQVVVEEVEREVDSSGKRPGRRLVVALAALLAVAVIGGALVFFGNGDDGDGTGATTPGSEPATTGPPTPEDGIEGDWSLASATFSESSFCDVDSCNSLDSLELTIECGSAGECSIDVAGEGDGRVTESDDGDGYAWHAYLPDVQGFAQLQCGDDPAPSNLILDFNALGGRSSGPSTASLEGTYRSEMDESASCGPAYVIYNIELRP